MTIVLPNHGDINWDVTLNTALTTLDTNITANANALIPKSTLAAKGDLLTATAASTVTRLSVGADGQVLTADSAQVSGVKWSTPTPSPVTSVAGKTGAVTLVESDITGLVADLAAKAADATVVHNTGAESIAGIKTFTSAPIVPTGAFPESAVANLTTDLAAKAADSTVVHNTGAESIAGVKTFTSAPVVPSNSFPESAITNLVSDLAGKVPTTRTITAGTGLTGGGDLSADRSFAVSYGTTIGTAVQGSDIPWPSATFSSNRRLPQWRQPSLIITTFQSGHGWTNNAGSTIVTNDTSDFILGTQACKLTSGGTGASANLSKTGMAAFDTTGKVIRLRLKIDDITHMTGLNFFLGSSSLANNYKWIIQGGAAGSNFVTSGDWVVVTLNWHDATVTGTPARNSITDARIQIVDDATATVTLHANSVELIPDASTIFPNGVVSITFDDSYQSVWDFGMPKLSSYGYPASVYTIQDLIGSSGRFTYTELTALQDIHGWETGSHANTDADHSLTYTGLTAAQLDTDLRALKGWGDTQGFRGSGGTAYPLGQYGKTTDNVSTTSIVRRYFDYARTTNSKTKETFPPADPYRLRAISSITTFAGGYPPSNLTTATTGDLDKAKANQTWLILVFHKIVTGTPAAATEINQTDFNNIIDSINSKGIPVLPIGDVLRYYA